MIEKPSIAARFRKPRRFVVRTVARPTSSSLNPDGDSPMSLCRIAFTSCFVSVLGLVTAQVARATTWPMVPLEVLVDEATLIVAGEVSDIKAPGFDVPEARPQELAVIKVASIFKALPGVGKPKEIGILQPAPSTGLVVGGGDLRFSVGHKAIWLVRKDPNLPAYRISHPFQVQPAGDTKKLTELVKARAKLPGGK